MTRLAHRSLLALLLALSLPAARLATAAENPAATVLYAFGSVSALDARGQERALARGAPVYSGETVQTRAGRTHLRLTDGGFAALQPNTSYKFEDYSWSGTADGSEKGVFSLLRGALRVVTGAIGKANRSSFRLTTPTATIGIRGTSGLIQTCNGDCGDQPDGTYLTGYGGVWDLTSGGFNGPVSPGETYFCDGTDCRQLELPPTSRTEVGNTLLAEEQKKTEIAPPQDKADGIRADQVDSNGSPMILTDLPLESVQPNQPQFGNGFSFATAVGTGLNTQANRTRAANGNVVVNAQGNVVGLSSGPTSNGPGGQQFSLLTNDLSTYRAAALAAGRTDIIAILDTLSPSLTASLAANPASLVEYLTTSGVAPLPQVQVTALADQGQCGSCWAFGSAAPTTQPILALGRFANGNLLQVDALSSGGGPFSVFSGLENLTGLESRHFILGAPLVGTPGSVIGTYNFNVGSASTTANGDALGLGVVSGQLSWDFLLSQGTIAMLVSHAGTDYDIQGELFGTPGSPLFSDAGDSVVAIDTFENPYFTAIDGFFAGAVSSGAPLGAGLQYTINTPNPIFGTAAFLLGSVSPALTVTAVAGHTATSAPFGTGNGPGITPSVLVFANDLFVGVGGEDSFLDQSQNVVYQSDIATTNVEAFREVARQSGGQAALRLAILSGITPSVEAALNQDPAEWTEDGVVGIGGPDSLAAAAFGRFMTGGILNYKHSRDANNQTLSSFTSLETFSGTQARHVVYGEAYSNLALPSLVGSFDFVGGTPSTTEGGGNVGLGITQGRVVFDFIALSGTLDMTVNHDALDWVVSGSFSGLNNGQALTFDAGGLSAIATGQPSTNAQVSGVFLGAPDLSGLPPGLGLAYQIFTLDPIVGAGVFSLVNSVPSTGGLRELAGGGYVSWAAPLLNPVISLGLTLGTEQDYFQVGPNSPLGSPGTQYPTANVDSVTGDVRSFAANGNPGFTGSGAMEWSMVNPGLPLASGSIATGSTPIIGWSRFGTGPGVNGDYDLTLNGQAVDRTSACSGTNSCGGGDFYVAYAAQPTPSTAAVTGSSTYTLTNGATTLTLREAGGTLSNTAGTIDSVNFQLDFTNGLVSVAGINMSYPDLQASAVLSNTDATTTFALGAPIVVNVISGGTNIANLSTTQSVGPLSACLAGCGMSGQMVIIPAGSAAENLVGTFRADVLAGPDASVTGGFIAGSGLVGVAGGVGGNGGAGGTGGLF